MKICKAGNHLTCKYVRVYFLRHGKHTPFSTTKANRSLGLREIIAVCSEKRTKDIKPSVS
jgi:hypothetical protein